MKYERYVIPDSSSKSGEAKFSGVRMSGISKLSLAACIAFLQFSNLQGISACFKLNTPHLSLYLQILKIRNSFRFKEYTDIYSDILLTQERPRIKHYEVYRPRTPVTRHSRRGERGWTVHGLGEGDMSKQFMVPGQVNSSWSRRDGQQFMVGRGGVQVNSSRPWGHRSRVHGLGVQVNSSWSGGYRLTAHGQGYGSTVHARLKHYLPSYYARGR